VNLPPQSGVFAMLLLTLAALQSGAAAPATPRGETVLDNSRVWVQKFVVPPGQSIDRRGGSGDQLLVFVKGGMLTSREGRATVWRDGRVLWRDAGTSSDLGGSTNTGAAPIEMIEVTLKPVLAARGAAAGSAPKYRYLNYPNIPGEDLLENESVIVQRFTVNPGQWEGVHAHHPDMLYIHIKGGQWAARSKREPEHAYPEPSPDGEVGWMSTIDISEGHESRNIGKDPIDLIWVTLKK
jgi:mannose-6-phosphate isomerase-like protein (cupin superfamily)